jgi:MbtH protein
LYRACWQADDLFSYQIRIEAFISDLYKPYDQVYRQAQREDSSRKISNGLRKIFQMNATEPTYRVVVNDEDQYSILLAHKSIPNGWRDVEKVGTKEECLEHIERVWTDMRPRSVRQQLENNSR